MIQYQKKLNDETKMRSTVSKLNWIQKEAILNPDSKANRKARNLKKYLLENKIRKDRRKDILKMMEKEAKHWLYFENIDNALKNSVIIPDNLHYQSDYFVKLQEKASLMSEGLFEEVEDYQTDQRTLQFKNSKLIPLYANITGILSRMKENEVERLFDEYEISMHGLKEINLSDSEKKKRGEELSLLYDGLIKKVRRDLNKPKKKLEILEEKLLFVYNLLLMWREYTQLLNMRFEDVLKMMGEEPQK